MFDYDYVTVLPVIGPPAAPNSTPAHLSFSFEAIWLGFNL
jgi:hypothetical protein